MPLNSDSRCDLLLSSYVREELKWVTNVAIQVQKLTKLDLVTTVMRIVIANSLG